MTDSPVANPGALLRGGRGGGGGGGGHGGGRGGGDAEGADAQRVGHAAEHARRLQQQPADDVKAEGRGENPCDGVNSL